MSDSQRELTGCRVLLVEDEALVSMLVQDMLEDLGCEVVAAASRLDEAMLKAGSTSFDLAILDVNLDGKATLPVAEVIAKRGLPFVFATGYGATSIPAEWKTIAALQKPFQQDTLERALRTMFTRS